ncbi:hypothetical protein [Larkinella soli]|uniref:hypothetical protein n=1 Tax=Larkinella soli TaxID=1770527 RepID=UPI000FFBDA44|nr:hypothetical protein [Larkinella soli]
MKWRSSLEALFILNAFLICAYLIALPLWKGELGYTLAETLMNYTFGFYRRALMGNLLIHLPGWVWILAAITLLYTLCLMAPLVLIRRLAKGSGWTLPVMIALFYCPFGTALYLKDPLAVRKELFFYLLFWAFYETGVRRPGWRVGAAGLLIGLGCLIHESFLFLFLPFLLGFLWLNAWVARPWQAVLGLWGVVVTLLLSYLPGNSAAVTEQLIGQYVALGFERAQFTAFEYFQKLPPGQNIREASRHLTGVNPLVYGGLYLLFGSLLWVMPRLAGARVQLPRPKDLLIALAVILVAAFSLGFIAMDYGRWLGVAFTTSLLLTASQLPKAKARTVASPGLWGWAALLVCFAAFFVLRVPHFTDLAFDPAQWAMVHRLLGKDLLLLAVAMGLIRFSRILIRV